MKNIKLINKIILILLIICITCFTISTQVNADFLTDLQNAGKIVNNQPIDPSQTPSSIRGIIGDIASISLYVSIFLFIGIAMIIGIKYMLAAINGQADKKASIKKSLVIFLVGSIVTFGAVGIFNLVVNMLTQSGISNL